MTTPALVSTPTVVASSTGGTSFTITTPSSITSAHKMYWLIFGQTASIFDAGTPSGWTVRNSGYTATGVHFILFYKTGTNSEPGSYASGTFTSMRYVSIMFALDNVDLTTPFDVADVTQTSGTGAVTLPAITPVTTGALILGVSVVTIASGLQGNVWTSGNMTVDEEEPTTAGSGTNIRGMVGHMTWSGSGPNTPTATQSATYVRFLSMSFAVRPAGTDATVTGVTATATAAGAAPAVSAGATITDVVATATSTGVAPTVSGGATVAAVAATATAGATAPTVNLAAGVTAVAATATAAAVAPVISGGAGVLAVAATSTAGATAPSLSIGAGVTAPAAEAAASSPMPAIVAVSSTFVFEPPTHEEPVRTFVNPLRYYRLTWANSVVRVGPTFTSIRTPSAEVVAASGGTEGEDYFRGGYVYTVSDETAAELTLAGFTVVRVGPPTDEEPPPDDGDSPAYGQGAYGAGIYGS